ncbi:hypothetical protein LSAT2_024509, partial [Lamellibrachia satsuma]
MFSSSTSDASHYSGRVPLTTAGVEGGSGGGGCAAALEGGQDSVKKKKQAFKICQRTKTETDEQAYRDMNKEAKGSNDKIKGLRGPVQEVGVERGYQRHLQLASPRHRRTLNTGYNIYNMDTNRQIVRDPQEIKNQRDPIEPTLAVDGPVPEITTEDIQKQLRKMKNNKSRGPDEIPNGDLDDCRQAISGHLMPNHEQNLSGGNPI